MSYALTRLTGDGSTTTFTIGFTYRDKADLVVKVDGVAQAINTDYTIATGGTQITFTSAPANNAAIFFQRATSQNTRLVDYTAGAVFKESDLDTDSIQGFYMSQEAIDIANEAIGKDASNRFDAQGSRIINVADPVDNTDAVNKQFISTNLPNINTVAGIADDVTTVAGISSDVTAVAADASDIGTVSTDIANVNAVATDIANVNAVAADASDIGTVSSNIASVNTVATNITDVNSYANTYFISATAPSSPTVGDLWFDTTFSVMKVYKGASGGWQNTGADSIVNGTANRYNYVVGTASGSYTGSTTSFPAAYDVGYVDVYLNGVKQVLGTDFTATDGATVVLSTAASTSDAVDIVAYGTFELGPTSTSTESFTGNGTTTSFTLSSDPGGAGSGCVVYIDGVYQERTGYSINGDALEFTEAPPANASIEVLKFTVNSIGSADSTAVTFTQDGTGAVQRSVDSKLNEFVSVKDFGAVGDGVTDDTDAIQAAIDANGDIYFPEGTYIVTSTLTLDVATTSLIGGTNVKIDSSSGSQTALLQINGSESPPYFQNGNGIYRIHFIGNGGAGTQTCLNIDNALSGGVSHINIEGCNIEKFLVGIYYGDNAYLIRHNSTDIFRCGTCLLADGTGTDYGENLYYNGCAFYNSTNVADIEGIGMDLIFHSCSFDYSDYIFKKIDTAQVYLTDCHVEYPHKYQDSFCTVQGNEGALIVKGGVFLGAGTSTSTARLGYINSATCMFTNTRFHNFGNTVTTRYLIETNGATTRARDNHFLDTNLANVGLFDTNIAKDAPYTSYISSDTSPITKAYTGTNVILTQSSNVLSVTKAYGGGSNCSFLIYIPTRGAERLNVGLDITSNGQTGTAYLSFGVADTLSVNDDGLPRLKSLTQQGTSTIDVATDPTVTTFIAQDNDIGNGYFYISCNWFSVNGSGNTADIAITGYSI